MLELIAECCNEVIGNINEGVVDDIEDVGVRKEPLLLLKLPIGKKIIVVRIFTKIVKLLDNYRRQRPKTKTKDIIFSNCVKIPRVG